MKSWLLLVIVGLAIYFGGRALGWFGGAATPEPSEPPTAAAGTGAAGTPAKPANPTDATHPGGSTVPVPLAAGGPPPAPAPGGEALARADRILAEATQAFIARQPLDMKALGSVTQLADPRAAIARGLLEVQPGDENARRDVLQALLLAGIVPPADRPALYQALRAQNAKTLFTSKGRLETEAYKVVSGDSLDRICRRYRDDRGLVLAPGLLQEINGLTSNVIRIDQTLRIPLRPGRIEVSKGSRMLRYFLGDALLREYRVAIGKDDKTPPGTYRIKTRQIKTPWRNPLTNKIVHFGDPDYAIGTRWLGFEDTADATGLGIHGTNDPASIGKAESLGCIRMLNEHVEDLFELVPIGTEVVVLEDSWPGT